MSSRIQASSTANVSSNQASSAFGAARASAAALVLALVFVAGPRQSVNAQTLLPGGTVGQTYNQQFNAAGGRSGYTWEKAGGTWDFGLDLAANGTLSGTPIKAGRFTVSVKVTDSSPTPQMVTMDFAIVIAPDLRILPPGSSTPQEPPRLIAPTPASPGNGNSSGAQSNTSPSLASSNSDSMTISVSNRLHPDDANRTIDLNTGKIKDGKATELIEGLIGRTTGLSADRDDYCVVHIVKWRKPDGVSKKYESDERWHLFRKVKNGNGQEWKEETNQEGRRIYGKRRVAFLIIHLKALPDWDIKYAVKVTGKIPTPFQNLLELVSIAGARGAALKEEEVHLWGAKLLDNITEPSDLAVKGNTQFPDGNGGHSQQPKDFERVFDNEGRYIWDVSVGLPFKEHTDLEYEFNPSDPKANSGLVTVRKKSRQNAYGFFNLFFKKVDLKQDGIFSAPHLVFGLPIAGKPLDRPMAGVGLGIYQYPIKFNFFVGAVFNRVQSLKTLQTGDTTNSAAFNNDLQSRRVTKLIFGVNIPIRQFRDALKK